MNIYETPNEARNIDWRITRFAEIAETGIQICVYGCDQTIPRLREFAQNYSNVKVMELPNKYTEMPIHAACYSNESVSLPDCRNHAKDTAEYISLMHAKIEYVNDAVLQNPWNSTVFAWMDFSMSYMFQDKIASFNQLRRISNMKFIDSFFAIPGCWDKIPPDSVDRILNSIHWRFCGTFFIADARSISHLYDLYSKYHPLFLETHHKLIWEVNFWAWLESNTDWNPTWYSSDHNDRIIEITPDVFSRSLSPVSRKIQYPYPILHPFIPTSASYLFHEGRHWLNTRFVNYWMYPNGCYLFHSDDHTICNKNILSELNPDDDMRPLAFHEMDASTVALAAREEKCLSEGLEDIRLYSINGEVKFIATSINYSATGRPSMVTGKYHLDTFTYSDCRLIHSPYDAYMEKNWIPIAKKGTNGSECECEHFIYKWSPMEIGHVDEETGRLVIDDSYPVHCTYFHRIRGSSPFVETEEGMVGVVHFSEEKSPRHYSHMLVLLEKNTFRPLKCTEIFHFEQISIEFCVGFMVKEEDGCRKYYFWISRFDRDPALIVVDCDELPFSIDIL